MKNLEQKCNVLAWRPRPIICGGYVACGVMQVLYDYLLLAMYTKLMQSQRESGDHQLLYSIRNYLISTWAESGTVVGCMLQSI